VGKQEKVRKRYGRYIDINGKTENCLTMNLRRWVVLETIGSTGNKQAQE
jgi:hypothetical protein